MSNEKMKAIAKILKDAEFGIPLLLKVSGFMELDFLEVFKTFFPPLNLLIPRVFFDKSVFVKVS
jgi:hypothetical protein